MSSSEPPSKVEKLAAFGYTLLLAGWALGYIFLVAQSYVRNELLSFKTGATVHINDFLNMYEAAMYGWRMDHHNIYDPLYQLTITNQLIAPLHVSDPFVFPYPPFVCVLLAPLAPLSMAAAFLIFTAVSLGIFIAAYAFVSSRLVMQPRKSKLILLGFFASLPAYEALYLGELAWLVTALILLFFYFLFQKKDIRAGIMLAGTTIKPTFSPLLVAAALGLTRFKLLVLAAATELLMMAAAACLLGKEALLGYFSLLHHIYDPLLLPSHGLPRMASIRGPLTMLMGNSAYTINLVILAIVALVVLYQWLQTRRKTILFYWTMSTTIVAAVCFSPHEHLYDCLPLLLPAMLTLETLSFFELKHIKSLSLRIWHLCFLSYPIFGGLVFLFWELYPPLKSYAFPFTALHLVLFASGLCYWFEFSRAVGPAVSDQETDASQRS